MKSNLNFLFAILVVIGIVSLAMVTRSCGHPPMPPFFDKAVTLEEATSRSATSGRPVLALVTADWCPPCASLKRGALTNRKVVAWITEHTEPVYLDMTRTTGTDARSQMILDLLHVEAYPSIVIMQRGRYFSHIEGDVSGRALLKWLTKVNDDLANERAAEPGQP
jgi:thiol:disulfide interchange protein